ncbi:MAG: Ig-like domain-containing protein [Myxococcaceae bacterium]
MSQRRHSQVRFLALGAAVLLIACESPIPARPDQILAEPNDSSVALRWSTLSLTAVSHYNVYWGTSESSLTNRTTTNGPANSFVVSGLNNGTRYYFALDAENELGQRSERSAAIAATPGTSAGTPTGAPRILGTVPHSGSLGVSLSTFLRIDFTEPISRGSLSLSVNPPIALGPAIWSSGDRVVTFAPTQPLLEKTTYVIDVLGQDLQGEALAWPAQFAFVTDDPDNTPPTVLDWAPKNTAPASILANILVEFSESMRVTGLPFPVTVTPDFPWNEYWDASAKVFAIVPLAPLSYGTTYTVTIGTGARDLAGNPMAQPHTFTFATEAVPDIIAPTVIWQNPPMGSTQSNRQPAMTVRFSEPMNRQSPGFQFHIITPWGYTVGTTTWSIDGREVTFAPAQPFPANCEVEFLVSEARDLAGNVGPAHMGWFNVL